MQIENKYLHYSIIYCLFYLITVYNCTLSVMINIPTYALYGHFLDGITSQYLHYETIRDRSREHNWSIKPHKHQRLCQIFLLRSGGVKVQLGDWEGTTNGPVIIFIPPPVIHKFNFPKNIDGSIVTLELTKLLSSAERLNLPKGIFEQTTLLQDQPETLESFEKIFRQIETACSQEQDYKNTTLQLLSEQLIVSLASAKSTRQNSKNLKPLSRQEERVQDFVSLIEENYDTVNSVEFYAKELNISSVQLTRTCRNVLGRSPNDLIISRKLLEAKRLLKYGQISIHEISYKLAFSNIGYFSRLFKLKTGLTPSDFRNSDH